MHTKEPWKIMQHPELVRDSEGKIIARADPNNADRIVACVNALAGIDDPAAFMAAVRELRADYKRYGLLDIRIALKLFALLPPETAS